MSGLGLPVPPAAAIRHAVLLRQAGLITEGEAVILARPTTDPDDVMAMSVAAAVITELAVISGAPVDDPDIAQLTRWARAESPHGAPGSLPELLLRRKMEKVR
ncbi:hypothetical protein [Nocardia jinanensis]|uniref:Uncharacterized protein n=1 Tax=Nocardia jinanensis TaxID=382504 RepID=A0A917VRK2_9NOCA|nr:hypothetical protein [Nocardia jinanensis]GGL07378.1 hypothetical protein GCM10011588_22340 [Nocardia jinanensis]